MKLITDIITVGVLTGTMLLSYSEAAQFVKPILSRAVAHTEANVATMEELGFSGAAEARAQWESEDYKPTALRGIQSLDALAETINATPVE